MRRARRAARSRPTLDGACTARLLLELQPLPTRLRPPLPLALLHCCLLLLLLKLQRQHDAAHELEIFGRPFQLFILFRRLESFVS